jgi:quinol monooxygenase YgiN
MVITEAEAVVPSESWAELRASYRSMTERLPPQLVRTSLLQDSSDPTVWRVATTWKGEEALEEYRRSVETPASFALFRSVGVEPERRILRVVESASTGDSPGG